MEFKEGDLVWHQNLKKCVVIGDDGNGMVDLVDTVMYERGMTEPRISVHKEEIIKLDKKSKFFQIREEAEKVGT